jgi:signal transduction histidine kinase
VGRSKAQLEGRPITLIPELGLNEVSVAAAIAKGTSRAPRSPEFECQIARPDGTSVWVAVMFHVPPACFEFATPSSLLLGLQESARMSLVILAVFHAFAVAQDITERKAVEQKTQEAQRAKGRFLAAMSHEIRTPLNGLIGAVEMLGSTELSSEQRGWVTMLQDTSQLLLLVVNDVLGTIAAPVPNRWQPSTNASTFAFYRAQTTRKWRPALWRYKSLRWFFAS